MYITRIYVRNSVINIVPITGSIYYQLHLIFKWYLIKKIKKKQQQWNYARIKQYTIKYMIYKKIALSSFSALLFSFPLIATP